MAELLRVPEVAVGVTAVVISEWLVEVGQGFRAGDPIAAIETDKAVVEVEAEAGATLLRALVAGGSQVEVGTPMALLGSAEELESDLDDLLVQLGVSPTPGPAPPPRPRELPDSEAESPAPGQDPPPQSLETTHLVPAAEGERGTRFFISPIARKRLLDAGIAPEGISGTGPNGRVLRRDVEPVIAASKDRAPRAGTADTRNSVVRDAGGAGYTEVPHTRVRLAVARRLAKSKQEVPHFYVKRTVVLDALMALRLELNQQSPVKISLNDFIIRAVAVAHLQVPAVNSIWTDEAMRLFDSVDISVAIASPRGLFTPVLRGVEASNLSTIASSVRAFVAQAEGGRLRQRDLEGGSITVSNLGMFGVDQFSAIINPPQSAILAVGAGTPTARVVDGVVTAVTALDLVLSVDHRAVDGALAAEWMAALVQAVEHPLSLVV